MAERKSKAKKPAAKRGARKPAEPSPALAETLAPLTYRQRLFVAAYLGESKGNATDAARRAGYADPNGNAQRLTVNDGIRAALEVGLAEAGLSADEILARLSDMATADMSDFVDARPFGFVLDLVRAKAAGKTHLIKKLAHTKYGVSIELHDAKDALVHLGRYHKLFVDRHEHDLSRLSDEELIARAKGALAGGSQAGPVGPDD